MIARFNRHFAAVAVSLPLFWLPVAHAGQTTRVSLSSAGAAANDFNGVPAISGDGRLIAFGSSATNLVTGDGNGVDDVFVRDRAAGATTRISVNSKGEEANGWSGVPAISGDGRIVVFYSDATNLVTGDNNAQPDIFAHDRLNGKTTRVNISSSGAEANNWSAHAAVSANGRYVAFASDASNLVAGDTNNARDVFVHDRWSHTTQMVSVNTSGQPGNGHATPPR